MSLQGVDGGDARLELCVSGGGGFVLGSNELRGEYVLVSTVVRLRYAL